MKSIKPGRGPSAMGGIGSIFAAVFGVIWTMAAASMGAPVMFSLFGIIFIIMALVQGAYHWKNAISEERFSEYDIVDSKEEADPLNRIVAEGGEIFRPGEDTSAKEEPAVNRDTAANRESAVNGGSAANGEPAVNRDTAANRGAAANGESAANRNAVANRKVRFCPYCGTPVKEDFEFCGSCGKELPDRK